MSAQNPGDVEVARIRSSAFGSLARASEHFGKGVLALFVALVISLLGAYVIGVAMGSAFNQAMQTVQSMEESGLYLTPSQVQQIVEQNMKEAYGVAGFITLLLLTTVYYVGKYVARGARLAWRGFSRLEGINAAPYSVEARLGAITFIIGSLMVGVTLMIALWGGILFGEILLSGNAYSAQEFLITMVSSTHWFTVTSWVVLVLGGVITAYAFLRCAGICGVSQAKGGAVASIVGFLLILFSLFLSSVILPVALKVIGLIVALVGFHKAGGGYLLME